MQNQLRPKDTREDAALIIALLNCHSLVAIIKFQDTSVWQEE